MVMIMETNIISTDKPMQAMNEMNMIMIMTQDNFMLALQAMKLNLNRKSMIMIITTKKFMIIFGLTIIKSNLSQLLSSYVMNNHPDHQIDTLLIIFGFG